MGFSSALTISSAGLMAERLRLDIAASNLANAESTRTEAGGAYRKRLPVMESVEMPFDSVLEQQMMGGMKLHGVQLAGVVESKEPLKREYRPDHPDADDQGYVELPNVSVVEEMVNMIQASRAYEANMTALNTTKALMLRTYEIGSV